MQSDEIPLLTPMFKPLVRKLGYDKWLSPDTYSKNNCESKKMYYKVKEGYDIL
jgi:hypothetical protein